MPLTFIVSISVKIEMETFQQVLFLLEPNLFRCRSLQMRTPCDWVSRLFPLRHATPSLVNLEVSFTDKWSGEPREISLSSQHSLCPLQSLYTRVSDYRQTNSLQGIPTSQLRFLGLIQSHIVSDRFQLFIGSCPNLRRLDCGGHRAEDVGDTRSRRFECTRISYGPSSCTS